MQIELKDLGSCGLPTVKTLTENERKFFDAFFKNVSPDGYDSNESFASSIHDAMDCLKALDVSFLNEFGTGDFVEISEFETGTNNCRMILIILSDADMILRRLFSVEFFYPVSSVPVAAKVVVRKK